MSGRRPPRPAALDRAAGRRPRAPRALGHRGATRAERLLRVAASGASSTQTAPSAKSPATSAATARASRVLPTPPGPVSVTRRTVRAAQQRARRGHLALAADQRRRAGPAGAERRERRRVERSVAGAASSGRAAASRAARAAASSAERLGQQADGLGAGGGVDAALQVLDAAGAEAGPLGQPLLGQAGGQPVAAQQRPERRGQVVAIARLPVGVARWRRQQVAFGRSVAQAAENVAEAGPPRRGRWIEAVISPTAREMTRSPPAIAGRAVVAGPDRWDYRCRPPCLGPPKWLISGMRWQLPAPMMEPCRSVARRGGVGRPEPLLTGEITTWTALSSTPWYSRW